VKRWLAETHGPFFELLRHFLLRFFDSDLVTTPGQTKSTLIWGFSLGTPWFLMFGQALFAKYRAFSGMSNPAYYRDAVRADELWLVTLTMASVGLLAAVKWQSLFPQPRDYYALGSLPLRPRQIFLAKLAALIAVAGAAVVTFSALPTLMFPMVSAGRWSLQPSLLARIGAHAVASMAAAWFFFFAMVAVQGLLLLCGPRRFARWGGTVQGVSAAVMLILIVLSFSIGPPVIRELVRSSALQWLPPAWFLGLYQTRLGDPDPLMRALSSRAAAGLATAAAIAFASYLLTYRRHRGAAMESAAANVRDRRWTGVVFDALVPGPRRQAIVTFLWKTLARSPHHRMVSMAYLGVAIAAVATAFFVFGDLFASAKFLTARFVSAHMILLLFLVLGCRHLFSIPSELRANWMFQMTEREGRDDWLDAIDGFVFFLGVAAVLGVPFPFEASVLGWRAVGEAILLLTLGLLGYDWLFSDWRKLPFTCSRLPGKTPLWITFLYGLAILTAFPLVNALLVETLFSAAALTAVLILTFMMWRHVHAARRVSWSELRLTYDEVPDPAIHGLNLLR
jgi:hypothetical protein